MNPILILAILAVSAMPAYAQGHQPDIAKLKADAQNVVKIISGDNRDIGSIIDKLDEFCGD